jgi:hypothetical protein
MAEENRRLTSSLNINTLRAEKSLTPMEKIDWTGVFWRKSET